MTTLMLNRVRHCARKNEEKNEVNSINALLSIAFAINCISRCILFFTLPVGCFLSILYFVCRHFFCLGLYLFLCMPNTTNSDLYESGGCKICCGSVAVGLLLLLSFFCAHFIVFFSCSFFSFCWFFRHAWLFSLVFTNPQS